MPQPQSTKCPGDGEPCFTLFPQGDRPCPDCSRGKSRADPVQKPSHGRRLRGPARRHFGRDRRRFLSF